MLPAAAAVLQPARRVVERTRMVFEVSLVSVATAEEKGKAVMGAGNYEGSMAGNKASDEVIAESIAYQDAIELPGFYGVNTVLQGVVSQLGIIVIALHEEFE